MQWDGNIPRRRYALFKSEPGALSLRVIREDDIERAEKWQGFVSWYGKERKREMRRITQYCGYIGVVRKETQDDAQS